MNNKTAIMQQIQLIYIWRKSSSHEEDQDVSLSGRYFFKLQR